MKRILLYLLITISCLAVNSAYAQLPVKNYFKVDRDYVVIDSTMYEFNNLNKDSIQIYKNQAKKYLNNLNPDKDSIEIMQTYHYIINANLDLRQQDSALVYLYKALNLPKVKSSKGAINLYWSIFRIYSYSENYLAQLEQISFLKELGEKYNYFKDTEPQNLQKAYGDVLTTAGYYKEASSYYTKHLVKDSLVFDPLRYAVVTNDLACIYEVLNKTDSVTKYREIALKTLDSGRKSLFDEQYKAYIKSYIEFHNIWYNKQFTPKSLKFAKAFLISAMKNYEGETHTSIFANHFIAEYYFYSRSYSKALFYINESLTLGYKKITIRKLEKLYFLKIRILDKLGKENLAETTLDKFNEIKANKLSENRRFNLIKYDVKAIKSEKVKAEKLAITNDIKRKNITYILILLSIILVIIIIAFIITRQKNYQIKITQEEVRQKLKEKEFLLTELNHRVKNNLALILSLVNFQSEEISITKYKNKFKSLEFRIRAIAIAHEQLIYNANDLKDEIHNLDKYLFKIANALMSISHREIDLNIETNNIKLNIDTLLPIGIMTNELISNSLKHAVSKSKLSIDINILQKKKKIYFSYKDSGIEFKSTKNEFSLGTEILESMVEQLNGTIEREDSQYLIIQELKNIKV